MAVVDLNADLGEGDELTDEERDVLGVVTSASVSCGAHAGSVEAIEDTLAAAAAAGVVVGAHPSYPDRQGMGRQAMDLPAASLAEALTGQIALLQERAARAGTVVRYVKPHGALYNRIAVDAEVGRVVVETVRAAGDLVLVLPAASVTVAVAGELGVPWILEAFADRAYQADGRLVPRGDPGALRTEEREVVVQALSIALERRARAADGTWCPLDAASICVHGDTPGAASLAAAVRGALEQAGVTVAPFVQ